MSRPRAVLLVAYGSPDFLRDALAPLAAEKVVVVDNSSRQDTRDLVEGLAHHYIDSGGNLGFAGGVNVGLRYFAATGFAGDVLLLNPDAVIEPSAIDLLQERLLSNEKLAAVGPALVTSDGLPQLTKYPLPSPRQVWRFTFRLPVGRHAVDFINGAALLLRSEAIAAVGEFDERFFLYGEEVDWQRRAFDLGWQVEEVSDAVAVHHVGGSSDTDKMRVIRVSAGQEMYLRIWYGTRGWTSYRVAGWIASIMRALPGAWSTAGIRARVFRLGPRRIAPLPPAPRGLSILHVSRGTQPQPELTHLAKSQADAGHTVTVLARCVAPADATGVDWQHTSGKHQTASAIRSNAPFDVVHAWDSGAGYLACRTGASHGGRVVTSYGSGRSGLGGLAARVLRSRVDITIDRTMDAHEIGDYRALAAASPNRRMGLD